MVGHYVLSVIGLRLRPKSDTDARESVRGREQLCALCCARVSREGRMELLLFIGLLSLVVSGGLLLAVVLNDPDSQGNTYSLADHELADLANPP